MLRARHNRQWQSLVVDQDETLDDAPIVWTWFPAEDLWPLYPDPNPRRELDS